MDPVQAEAEAVETVTVEYAGNTYTFPASLEKASFEVMIAIDDQKFSHAVRGLLGDGDFKKFRATKPTNEQATELFTEYAKAIGLPTVGE